MSDFVIENGVLVTYNGPGGDVVIPEDVTEIDAKVFYRNKNITGITIPASVTRGGSFAGCSNLRRIENYSKLEVLKRGTTKNTILTEGFLPGEFLDGLHPEYKVNGVICYLSRRKEYPVDEMPMYEAYIRRQIGNILEELIKRRAIKALYGLLEMGILKPAAIKNAIDQAENDPEIKAILLKYQGETVDIQKEQKKELRQAERSLTRTAPTVAELKKLWSTKELDDGTLEISSYKGNEEEVIVPAKIGKKSVTAIGKKAFSPYVNYTYTLKNKDRKLDDIKSIVIPEGITSIGFEAFENCQGLTKIVLPKSVSSICEYVYLFNWIYFSNLTIYAPSGSYAETYAKENGIRFEAI